MVAGSAEVSRSFFVARSRDVAGMRHWRDFCAVINLLEMQERQAVSIMFC